MKAAVVAIAVLAVSCGKIKMAGSEGLGQMLESTPKAISTADQLVFDRICNALTAKQSKFGSSLPTLIFDVQEKDCKGSTSNFQTQQVRIESTGSDFQLRRQDTNGLFVFPTVETPSSGVMAELCAGTANMPVMRNGEAIVITTSGFSSGDCSANGNEQCLMVVKASPDGQTNGLRIHTREFIKFNLNQTSGKFGYYTYRKAIARNNCDEGENTETSVSLR